MKKRLAKLIPAVLAASMMLSAASPVFADTFDSMVKVKAEFKDVGENAYYYTPVYWAKLNGITVGTSATTYGPNQPCTRGQMAAFLWRMNGSPEPQKTKYFTDVADTSAYAKAVAWAKEKEITVGTSATTYGPNQPCTRGQMATFLWRLNGSPEPAKTEYFEDVATDSSFAKAVAWAKENGITSGTTATTFTLGRTCTRGEMAMFLWKQSDSPEVQISKWIVDKPAWDETVVDKPAYDEQVLVQEAWDEPVYGYTTEYHCNGCGAVFYSAEELDAHEAAAMQIDPMTQCGTFWSRDVWAQTGTTHHDAVYQTVHHEAVTHVVHHEATGHWA